MTETSSPASHKPLERLVRADRWGSERPYLEIEIPGAFVFETLVSDWMDEALFTASQTHRTENNVYGVKGEGSGYYFRCIAHGIRSPKGRRYFIHNDHGRPLIYRLRRQSLPPTREDDQYHLPQPKDGPGSTGLPVPTETLLYGSHESTDYLSICFPDCFELKRFDGETWNSVGIGFARDFSRADSGEYRGLVSGKDMTFRSISPAPHGDSKIVCDEGGLAVIYWLHPRRFPD